MPIIKPRPAGDLWKCPGTPAYSTKGDQCCSTQARQQQGFRHWLGQSEQEAQYNAGHQQQTQACRAFKAREQAES